jgi:hypothetical protein
LNIEHPQRKTWLFTYRLPEIVTWWIILASIALTIIALMALKALAHTLVWYELFEMGSFFIMVGILWLGLKVSRTKCTLELDESGFEVVKHSRFNFLPRGEVRYPWSELSHYSSGAVSAKFRAYQVIFHLTNGKALHFITGTSVQELAEVRQLEEIINSFLTRRNP